MIFWVGSGIRESIHLLSPAEIWSCLASLDCFEVQKSWARSYVALLEELALHASESLDQMLEDLFWVIWRNIEILWLHHLAREHSSTTCALDSVIFAHIAVVAASQSLLATSEWLNYKKSWIVLSQIFVELENVLSCWNTLFYISLV